MSQKHGTLLTKSTGHRLVFLFSHLTYSVQLLYLAKWSRTKYHEFCCRLLTFSNAIILRYNMKNANYITYLLYNLRFLKRFSADNNIRTVLYVDIYRQWVLELKSQLWNLLFQMCDFAVSTFYVIYGRNFLHFKGASEYKNQNNCRSNFTVATNLSFLLLNEILHQDY